MPLIPFLKFIKNQNFITKSKREPLLKKLIKIEVNKFSRNKKILKIIFQQNDLIKETQNVSQDEVKDAI